jgi:hypothetical protein
MENESVPWIVKQMRSLNIGLSSLIYENKLKVADLHWFTKQELIEIKHRINDKELLQEIARLI